VTHVLVELEYLAVVDKLFDALARRYLARGLLLLLGDDRGVVDGLLVAGAQFGVLACGRGEIGLRGML